MTKILHLTFHKGCQKAIEHVSKELNLDLITWFIPNLSFPFDPLSNGNALYNIGHDRAERIWNLHQNYFDSFDIILTSDTAPLSRIFLQNHWEKKLIIWVCNRFDYFDGESLDCDFPDKEYYELFQNASHKENVKIVGYTAIEEKYALSKGINIVFDSIIKPYSIQRENESNGIISSVIDKTSLFFCPPYHNETIFMNATDFYAKLEIPCYCGRYNGPNDLKDFKAIIHLPYAASNLALFENIEMGLQYLIPSKSFFNKLLKMNNFFFQTPSLYLFSEWYDEKNECCFIYFDSWDDLKEKINQTDFSLNKEKIKQYSETHKNEMINRWKKIIF